MTTSNSDLNEKIAESILALLPETLFDSTGHPFSMWQIRLHTVADDTQGMLNTLFDLDHLPGPPPAKSNRIRRF